MAFSNWPNSFISFISVQHISALFPVIIRYVEHMKPNPFLPKSRLLLCLISFLSTCLASQAQDIVHDHQQFMEAYTDKKYEDCIRYGTALARVSEHPGIQYKVAECYCQSGKLAQSLDLLGLLAKRGMTYKPADNGGFAPLRGNKQFELYQKAFAKNAAIINRSSVSFTVNDSLLIPEGIAYDSERKTFYIGSLAKNKVIHCSGDGKCKDFVNAKDVGFWMVVGMKVSPDNKSLWVCSASEREGSNGYAGLFRFEIPSGKLLQKFTIENKEEQHLFNDVDFSASGDIYFSDSKAGKVWRVSPGKHAITEIASGYIYPNGLAIDQKNNILFVADFAGVNMIDLATGKRSKLHDQGATYLNGIDGLYYYRGSLIGIQDSGNQDDRVVRFYYDVTKGIITRTVVLQSYRNDMITPTTGTIINGTFHYIANAQLRSLQPDASLTNPEKLVKPVILKLKLD